MNNQRLKEGEDYYINDEGLFVFTELYHKKRGFCCGNRCKHCPFDWVSVKNKRCPK